MRLLFVLPLLAACIDYQPKPFGSEELAPDPASVAGRVCDVDRGTWLADAKVYTNVVADGVVIETREAWTDRDGRWELAELPGDRSYDLRIQHGLDDLSDQEVLGLELAGGQHVELPEPPCFDPLGVPIAVVTGSYESFPHVLDALGLAYDLFDGSDPDALGRLLTGDAAIFAYDIVLFEGGHLEEGFFYPAEGGDPAVPTEVVETLQAYVGGGGAVFASDWAYDVVEQAWPDRLDFAGDDSQPGAAQVGEYDVLKAAVSDQELAEWIDADTVPLVYDLPVWAPIEHEDEAVSVHIRGDVQYRLGQALYSLPDAPLLVSFTSGQGKVYYSSFRVAENSSTEILLAFQFLLYRL